MTTTFYICAGIGWIVTLCVAYALGHRDWRIDGIAEHRDFCMRRCAKTARVEIASMLRYAAAMVERCENRRY